MSEMDIPMPPMPEKDIPMPPMPEPMSGGDHCKKECVDNGKGCDVCVACEVLNGPNWDVECRYGGKLSWCIHSI